ncbi:MAG: general secretion pathway protein GspB [Nitrospirae bacterium]|nr:general secretion pathway protein GspB [Nitrospirota bacterium]
MSFILDALKKLEQKRQQGTVPDLMTVHAAERQRPEKHRIWPYFVMGALILNAGILAAVFRPWEAKDQKPAAPATVETQQTRIPEISKQITGRGSQNTEHRTQTLTEISNQTGVKGKMQASASSQIKEGPALPDKKTAKKTSKGPVTIASKTKIDTHSQKGENPPTTPEEKIKGPGQVEEGPVNNQNMAEESPTALRLNTSSQELTVLRKKIKEETSFATDVPVLKNKPVNNVKAESNKQVLEFSQLPEETKKELPNISISAHIYSNNPGARIANINGSNIREGEEVIKGLKVREITISGVIFDYQGLLFQVRAF